MAASVKRLLRFYVNRFSILYAGTGAVNALMIDGLLYLLTHDVALPLPVSTLVSVVTSIFTDYTWKSEVVFRSPLLSRDRFWKYFLNGSTATVIQYVLTLLLSTVIFYSIAYIIAVAVGFLFAYTISRLKIWAQFVPKPGGIANQTGDLDKGGRKASEAQVKSVKFKHLPSIYSNAAGLGGMKK